MVTRLVSTNSGVVATPAPAAETPSGTDGRQAALQRSLQNLVGQQVQASVLSKYNDGSVLIRVQDNAVRVVLPADVNVGTQVPLTVVAAEPRPTFEFSTASGNASALVYSENLPGGDGAEALYTNLPSQDNPATLPGGARPAVSQPGLPDPEGNAAYAAEAALAGEADAAASGLPGGAAATAGAASGALAGGAAADAAEAALADAALEGAADGADGGAAGSLGTRAGAAAGAGAGVSAGTGTGQSGASSGLAGAAGLGAALAAEAALSAGLAAESGAGGTAGAAGAGGLPGASDGADAAAAGLATALAEDGTAGNPATGSAANAASAAANAAAAKAALAANASPAALAAALQAGQPGGVKAQSLAAQLLEKAPLTPAADLPDLDPATPNASLSSAARVLTSLLSAAQGPAASLIGKTALFSNGQPDAGQLAQRLSDTIAQSGLFYESHVAQWVKGERSLPDLMREPQMQQLQQMQRAAQNAETAARAGNGPDLSAAQMINQQLHAHEQARVQWNGEAWPGQQMQWDIRREQREGGQNQGQDGGADGEPEQVWRSGVRFRFPLLGQLAATVTIAGDQIHIQMQADSSQSAATLRAYASQLEQAMEAAGAPLSSLTISESGHGG